MLTVSRLLLAGALAIVLPSCNRFKQSNALTPTPGFAAVYRSIKSLQAAVGVGVSYAKYGQLVRTFGTEVLVLQDAMPNQKQLLAQLTELLMIHKDCLQAWQDQIKAGAVKDIRFYPMSQIVASKYGLAPREISEPIVSGIWDVANDRSEHISGAMLGIIDITKQKPRSLEEVQSAALAKRSASECIEILSWNPDKQDRQGYWVVVGRIVNRCGKPFADVKLEFLTWHSNGKERDGTVNLDIGSLRPLEDRDYSAVYDKNIAGLRLKGLHATERAGL